MATLDMDLLEKMFQERTYVTFESDDTHVVPTIGGYRELTFGECNELLYMYQELLKYNSCRADRFANMVAWKVLLVPCPRHPDGC